eukprot:CAMPEP_0172426660 /NCGR_PEP_ID=MMETSP1064-20121228/38552_1 /TAXON_ID=202472 /ORGANISM="Aulacoseira subarctica , Strain CCAP 1002/5" /LENGTH=301 /DNA_ID=CAMNT_0013170393 /DNA_START=48 /DNA_END=950 /DNA_ORIENTATION=+
MTIRVAWWKEYFLNLAEVDRLNASAERIQSSAYLGDEASIDARFHTATMFENCCAMAASSLKSHVWFIHHFKQLGNPLIDLPDSIHNVALCGIDDNSEVCMIDPNVTFTPASFHAPKAATLFQIHDSNQLLAALDMTNSETVTFTGIIFLPPFLFGDLANTNKLDTASLYQEALTSINSWIASFDDDDNTIIQNRQSNFRHILQWLWAVHQGNLIPVTPIQPSPGPRERQWKSVTHQNHLLSGKFPSATLTQAMGNLSTTSAAPPTEQSSQLTSTLAKIADIFQQQHTEDSKQKELKEPGW